MQVHQADVARLGLCVLLFTMWTAAIASQTDESPTPRWTRKFQSGDLSIVNADASIDYGVPREPDDVQGAGVLQAVDAFQPVILAIEGDVNTGATIHGLDVHTGTTLWRKTNVRLQSWRPFESYRPGGGGNAYSAMVVGDTLVVLLARGKAAGGCADGRELAAFALTDGRLLWCSSKIPNGELTFVPVPERQQLLLWDRNATSGVPVQALDVLTGRHLWTTTLPIDSANNWLRFVSYFTTTGMLGRRPTLVHGRYLGLVLGQFRKVGGSWARMTVVVIDLASGELRWQVEEETHAGLVGPPRIWWTLNDRVVLVAVDKRLWAYDVDDGRRLWTARVEVPGVLEFAAHGTAQVALVEPPGGSPDGTAGPSVRAKGLSAIDLNTGKTLWTYRNEGRVGVYDPGTSTLVVSNRRQIVVLDAVSGVERLSFQSPLERDVQSARLVGNLVVLQSNNQLAAHDSASGKNVYVQTVPPPTRTAGHNITTIVVFVGAGLIGTAIWEGVQERRLRLRASYPVAAGEFAYFATGAGDRRRVVAVSSLTGQRQTIGSYARRKLGNLINEPHGIMHAVSDREIHSYEYGVDPARHDELHLAAEAGIARKTIERARAFAAEGQPSKAFGEATTAIARLAATETVSRSFTASLAERQLALAEAYEAAGELAPSEQKRDFTKQALSEYERLANSIRQAPSSEWGDWLQDLDRRIARIRTLLERVLAAVRMIHQATAVAFQEVRTPTVLRKSGGPGGDHNLPAHGTFEIEPGTGRVLASAFTADNPEAPWSATFKVRYAIDPTLEISVPVEVTERYWQPAKPNEDTLEGPAERLPLGTGLSFASPIRSSRPACTRACAGSTRTRSRMSSSPIRRMRPIFARPTSCLLEAVTRCPS